MRPRPSTPVEATTSPHPTGVPEHPRQLPLLAPPRPAPPRPRCPCCRHRRLHAEEDVPHQLLGGVQGGAGAGARDPELGQVSVWRLRACLPALPCPPACLPCMSACLPALIACVFYVTTRGWQRCYTIARAPGGGSAGEPGPAQCCAGQPAPPAPAALSSACRCDSAPPFKSGTRIPPRFLSDSSLIPPFCPAGATLRPSTSGTWRGGRRRSS